MGLFHAADYGRGHKRAVARHLTGVGLSRGTAKVFLCHTGCSSSEDERLFLADLCGVQHSHSLLGLNFEEDPVMCPTAPHFKISVQTYNISFLGLRPARGGNWGKCGLLKEFLEHCVGG